MKHKFAIFFASWLLLGSLFPQTNIGELCKVPTLILHHQIEHVDLSFPDFLALHYGENAPSHGKHDDLPMQKHFDHTLCCVFIGLKTNISLFFSNKKHLLQQKVSFWQNFYHFQWQETLFSPPENIFA